MTINDNVSLWQVDGTASERRCRRGEWRDVDWLSTSIRLNILLDGSTIYRGHNHNINITGWLKRASLICVLHNLGSATTSKLAQCRYFEQNWKNDQNRHPTKALLPRETLSTTTTKNPPLKTKLYSLRISQFDHCNARCTK